MRRILLTLTMALAAILTYAQSTPPATATQETWYLNYTLVTSSGDESSTEPMIVAFDGNDVYFQLPHPFPGNANQWAWVKGTIDAESGIVAFAKGQKVATYGSQTIYLAGSTSQDLVDASFLYSQEAGVFTALTYLLYNTSLDSWSPLAYLYPVTVTKEEPVTYEPIAAPEGLTTEPYYLKAQSIEYNADGSVKGIIDVAWTVNVGFTNSSEVYIQGICRDMPNAWIKGTLDDDEVTFAKGQFLGKGLMNVFFGGMFMNEFSDFIVNYDAATATFTGRGYYMLINSSAKQVAPYEVYNGITITKITDRIATPQAPKVEGFMAYNGQYGALDFSIPATDAEGNPLNPGKLGYSIYLEKEGQQELYTFTTAVYADLPADNMTVMPYSFEGYDFEQRDGVLTIYFHADWNGVTRIGIRSVYNGGGQTTLSDITWVEALPATIGNVTATARPLTTAYTDLQGRPLSATAKGLVLQTVRMSDGTVRTTKVLRP